MILEIDEILKILPHKHPYLLVDRVVEREILKKVVGHKAVSYSEDLFRGHYPEKPILPGAIIIEAASQVAGLLLDLNEGAVGYVIEVKNFRFKKPVKPGNVLEIEAVNKMSKGPFLLAEVKAKVSGEVVSEGELQLFIERKKIQAE